MFSWLQGPLFTVVCCVISFSYKASRSNKSKGVCYFPCLMYVHLTYSLSTWDSLATVSIACGGLKIRQPATIYCHCQVNLCCFNTTTMHNTVLVFQKLPIIYFVCMVETDVIMIHNWLMCVEIVFVDS